MTNFEFEEAYGEALLVAREREDESGNELPYMFNGNRVVKIDGIPYTEHEIFVLAWGENVARMIRQERDSQPQ